MLMNIQAEKLEIMKLILETDNPGVLEYIKKICMKASEKDLWDTLSKDQKDEILQGIEEVERGDVVDYERFMSDHRE